MNPHSTPSDPDRTRLRRSLGLGLLLFYGLGNIIGAGIYVLIGEVAANAGSAAPLAFLLSSVPAALTAFTYTELAARLPYSAGEAVYAHAAFRSENLSRIVGLLIALYARLPSVLRVPLEASDTLLEATTPVKLPTMHCPRRS